ncbi:MAG: hypothetical protein ACQEXJ_16025 [Myxococcota bacterium]
MTTVAIFAVLVAVAVLATWRRLARFRKALGLGHLVVTGHLFLVMGYLVGLPLTSSQRADLLPGLTPVTAVVAGWVGFTVGMAFHHRVLRRVSGAACAVALAPGVASAAVVGVLGLGMLALAGVEGHRAVAAALVLAAVASVSAPTLPRAARDRPLGRSAPVRGALRMMEFAAGLENLVAVALALLAFAVLRGAPDGLGIVTWWLGSVALGAIAGFCGWLFLGGKATGDERLLLGLGVVAVSAGLGEWLGLSPEGVCAVSGATLVNLPGDRMTRLRLTMERVERPAFVILMALVGFYAAGFGHWAILPLLGLLTVVRGATRWLAGRSGRAAEFEQSDLQAPANWGLGLVTQGGLGLVIALTFYQVWHAPAAGWILVAAAASAVVNEAVGPRLLARALDAPTAPPSMPRGNGP